MQYWPYIYLVSDCGMEQPMVVFSAHAAICGRAGKNVYKYVNKYVKSPKL